MKRSASTFFALIALALAIPAAGFAQSGSDEEGVRRAALDYLEGFYEGDSTKTVRSVRPEVTKYGFFTRSQGGEFEGEAMPFAEILAFVRSVRERGRTRPDTDPKEVEILDIQSQIAVVKVTAYWGTDYLQMARYDGRWMILHVIWQTQP